jgi:hypothetical protein
MFMASSRKINIRLMMSVSKLLPKVANCSSVDEMGLIVGFSSVSLMAIT